jgi:ribosomal protein S16
MYKPLIVKLQTRGHRKYRLFNIIVTSKQTSRRGGNLECVGFINPQQNERLVFLDSCRLAYWLNNGAKLQRTIYKYIYPICR